MMLAGAQELEMEWVGQLQCNELVPPRVVSAMKSSSISQTVQWGWCHWKWKKQQSSDNEMRLLQLGGIIHVGSDGAVPVRFVNLPNIKQLNKWDHLTKPRSSDQTPTSGALVAE